ncbi:toxin glutamine deamidase domain-containing protein [Streptomyces sp. NPDC086554]|uniref:toxin glutamine deamidase domain-containing protein n=1 Tax=Streptomyces sp. NPDC086554 TaxID=3154864 RepID=UPI00343973AD
MRGSHPASKTTTYEYDNGNQTKVTDAAGRVSSYKYDKFNRVTESTFPGGAVALTEYDAVGNIKSVTDPSGGKTTYAYDAADRLASTTSPRGNVAGADPAKHTTTYGYDKNGNLTKTVGPTGALTTTEYDSLNRPTLVTDPLKRTTTTKYDSNGNVSEMTDPLQKVTSFTYTPADLVKTVKNPLGKITTYGYDADGNRASVTSPLGHKLTWTYDEDGRVETEVDARGNEAGSDPAKYTTKHAYDVAGNLKQTTDPLGNTQKFEYNALGQQIAATNQNNETTKTEYNSLGRIKSVTAPDDGATSYTYDTAGNIKTRVDDNQHTTTYDYDAAQRLKSVTDPLNRSVSYGYDADGNRETATNARGTVSTTTHDALGRPTKTTYSDDTPDVTTVFDSVGNRKEVTDGTGTRTFTYDAANRLKTASVPGQAKGFAYSYDDAGQLTNRTLPHGRATTFTYDDEGNRQTAVTAGATSTYKYDPAGRLTSTQLPGSNGYTETRSFDAAGRLTDIASVKGDTTLTGWRAVLDPAGQPKRIDSQRKSTAESQYYTYDKAGRLDTECTSPTKADTCPTDASTTKYTYDKVGNRKSRTNTKGTTTYSYDDADQLTKSVTGSTTTDYGYDADGNQTKAGARTYAYDANNRLSTMTASGKTWGFTYDADGNRTKRTKTGVTLAWDINGELPQLAAEYTSTGALYADYQYNPYDEIESEHRTVAGADAAYYYHRDLVGSITDLTTATGASAKTYDYTSAFGTGGPGVDTNQPNNNFGYAGQYKEPVGGEDAGLADALGYNMRARTYDPAQGRFTGRDPLTPGQEAPADSSYTYTGNGPTHRYDPAGTCWWIPGSGDKSCWTTDIPGTEWIPLSPVFDKIGDSWVDSCESGSNYAQSNGRSGWSGCIDEFTGVGPMRRGVTSYQHGDIADGTFQCLGGIGQFGLFLMPGPKVPAASSESLAAAVGNLRWGAGGGGVTLRGLSYKTPETPELVKLINPLKGPTNCRACALAVDSTLSGAPASARLIPAGGLAPLEKFYPGKRFKTSNLSSIVEEIARGGPGARGILIGIRGANGHAFNIANVGGDVVFLDGQTGHAGSHIKKWRNFQFMRTR